ncbi:MAG: DNA polymerase/3'-5' exonuclease PolX [Candidatus Omnitrophica bacterium]|nr:DNA polymerase/3'-5' exonuclease PolX [Candidatus Omnitrophota bacterium]
MKNTEIAGIFRDIARILEIKGANPFRIRAYERAAQNIERLTEDIQILSTAGRIKEIPGIGEDLSKKIEEFLENGKIKTYEELKKSIPAALLELLKIPSVGPKTVKLLYDKLKIKSISDLEEAIQKNRLEGIFGIKEKTVENILKGIAILKKGKERMPLVQAALTAEEFVNALRKLPEVKKISVAGSLRRKKETVRDIDILIASEHPQPIMDTFIKIPSVKDVLAQGKTKSSVRTRDDVQVDCRIVEEKSFGAALLYFTGSKNFNIKLRQIAIKDGWKLNEYGLFKKNGFLAGRSEEEIFERLGLAYIEPELREDTGEIELAAKSQLPELLNLKDIRGDLHVHSLWSDGNNSIEEISSAAQKLGYSYIAITDHSQGLKVAGGLTLKELKKKKAEIEKLNKKLKNFRILYGTEADIDSKGNMDYKDEVLKEFDVVVAAIHSGFRQSKQQLTRRIVNACRNKYVHIIAHPTGRLWGVREAYDLDMDEIFKVACDTNTHMEINAFGERLDLNSQHCRRAKELGVRLAIGTDSHESSQLGLIRFGVAIARRGWLTSTDVINTLSLEELLKKLKK